MILSIIINVICDADSRSASVKIEQMSKDYTLDEVVNDYAETQYRRALALGWDQG